jgi:hypothetical protein
MTRSRNCLQVLREMQFVPLALVAATVLACSDQPTQPSTALSSDLSAGLGASGKSSGAVSTLEWQKSARDLVKSHGVSPINAIRIYALSLPLIRARTEWGGQATKLSVAR